MLEVLLVAALQSQTPQLTCELELNIPTGRRRREPKTFTVECPDYGTLHADVAAIFSQLDLHFTHSDWMTSATSARFRLDETRGWVPDGAQLLIWSPPELPRRITNRGFRDLECVWMAYPEADGRIELAGHECLLDGEPVPENLERSVRRTLESALETSRVLPETPGECVQDVARVSTFLYRHHYAFGWDGDGVRQRPNSRFEPLCPADGPDPVSDAPAEPKPDTMEMQP